MVSERELVVPEELEGERLDKFVAVSLSVSRTVAREMIDAGVLVDGEQAKPGDRVREGSLVIAPEPPRKAALEPEDVDFDVLYEDESLVVVDKPPGLVVHPGSGRRKGTLAAGLLHRYPQIRGVGQEDRWGLVHRLDKETSGALVVALTDVAYARLSKAIKKREVRRVYLTLVDGLFGAPTGTIDAPIGRDPTRPTRRAVSRDGKPARTHFEVREEYPAGECSLCEVTLETGRTHQIRVHMTSIEHKVIGDRLYGQKNTKASAPRVFLHASLLGLEHPVTGRRLEVVSDLPPDLEEVLSDLRSKEDRSGI